MGRKTGEIVLCVLWLGAVALSGANAIRVGSGSNELFMAMLIGSVVTLGAYDTRKNQPTHYNLLRTWPFGSAEQDDERGVRTMPSHALHAMMWVSVWLCLCQILFGHR